MRHETEIRHLLDALPMFRPMPYRGCKIERVESELFVVNGTYMRIGDAAELLCQRRKELKTECRQMAFFESLRN